MSQPSSGVSRSLPRASASGAPAVRTMRPPATREATSVATPTMSPIHQRDTSAAPTAVPTASAARARVEGGNPMYANGDDSVGVSATETVARRRRLVITINARQASTATIDSTKAIHTKRWGVQRSEIAMVPGPFGRTSHPFAKPFTSCGVPSD